MTDVYVVGTDMIKFGRFPERTVPRSGRAGGADGARRCRPDASRTCRRSTAATWCKPSRMVGQRILREIGQTGIPVVNMRQRLRHRRDRVPRRLDGDQGRHLRRRARGRRRADGQGPSRRRGGGKGIPTEGLLGSGTMPACSPMSASSTRANTARPSSSSPRCR